MSLSRETSPLEVSNFFNFWKAALNSGVEYKRSNCSFSGEIKQIEEKLRVLTGLTKPQIKGRLITDLGLTGTADWTDIFEKLNELYSTRQTLEYLNDCTYLELFNDKVMAVYGKREFLASIEEYISSLNSLPAGITFTSRPGIYKRNAGE